MSSKPFSLLLLLLLSAAILLRCAAGAGAAAAAQRGAFACAAGGPGAGMRFCDARAPVRERARDLVARLTRAEKVRLLGDGAAAVPRLGIAKYEWWSEALHGVANTGPGVRFGGAFPGATSFPQVITSAASFNASLWQLIGTVRIYHSIIIVVLSIHISQMFAMFPSLCNILTLKNYDKLCFFF